MRNMKKLIMLAMVSTIALPIMAASRVSVNGYSWTVKEIDNDTAIELYSISGNAAISPASGDVTIPSTIWGKPVTSIGSSAFIGCSGITSVTIPDSVTRIGSSAFSGCSGLTSVTVPDSVTSIGSSAFSGCSGLVEITLPFVGGCRGNEGSTDSLFGFIFGTSSYTGGIKTRQTSRSSSFPYSDFSADYYIPSGLKKVVITDETKLWCGAFYNCSGLTSVTLPYGLTSIGSWNSYAFRNCTGLTSVLIPNSVTNIGDGAFYDCSGLTNVTIPDSVTSIGGFAFYGCSGLTDVTIPDSVTSIGNSAFRDCSGLTNVTIPDGITDLWAGIFYGCTSLEEVKIPDSVRTIAGSVFTDCTSLKYLTIGNGVTNVMKGTYAAFAGCSSLERIVMPQNLCTEEYRAIFEDACQIVVETAKDVTSIGSRAFLDCANLSMFIGATRVAEIGDEAFKGSNLKTVILTSEMEPVVGNGIFDATPTDLVIYVPATWNVGETWHGRTVRKIANLSALYDLVKLEDGDTLKGALEIPYSSNTVVSLDGKLMLSSTNSGDYVWQPQQLGQHTITIDTEGGRLLFDLCGTNCITKTLNIGSFDFYVTPEPNPPMAKDYNVSITPTTRNFGVSGGGNAIIVSGSSATWTAAASDSWITLNAASGNVGYPVAYTVSANTNVEQRTGYVYVSGWVHTVTQDGVGGTISPENATFEHQGGSGTIAVSAANKMVWQARPNVDWLSVTPTSGAGAGSVTFQVAPYNEVATRQGTLTVAGNTFTVFQYGRRMKLEPASTTQNYETHVIPITVNALALTQWSVTPNNSWISVVDAGNGRGGDLVTISIGENPSYRKRTGTVTIGTETFTVTQQGRPTEALSFAVSPANSTASVDGANGVITVTATPDLPWTATSGANWCTVYAATANGAGNGNVVYSASPNPTLLQRTGTITVTPEAASGMSPKTHTVTQPAAQSSISMSGYEFEASGESCSVEVSVANIVEWTVNESLDWLTVNGATARVGPGTVTLQAAANDTIYPRSGTVMIAGKSFSVSQKGRGVEVEYDTKLFGTDGGYESISIHPDGNVSWTAEASDPTWITIFQGDSGTGDGEIMYIISPYVGDGAARTGWITVGDKKVYITQRAYDLNIEPNGTNVVGNAGAGEFGVSASIGDVWTAIVTEPWITLVDNYDSGTGNGVVRFLYAENNTGKTRTGKIIVAGEVYTLEQRARTMVAITTTAEHGGHVSGGGLYDLGSQATLTAVPDSGYAFSYWTGAVSSMQNPLRVTVDTAKSYTAVFEPLPIAFSSVESGVDGVSLAWNNLAWAGTYRIYRGVTSVPSSATVLAELPNNGNCTYLDVTGGVGVEYWYWIEAEGPLDEVMSDPRTGRKVKPIVYSSITYMNLRGATNPNPGTYQEGTLVSFQNPGAVTGYTFAGWTPAQITSDMTGAQTVRAAWTANSYSIAYNPNGGSGTMNATAATYDSEATVAANGFTWAGHVFAGWATNDVGEVVYAAGATVSNLTAQSSGVVTLYAVWEPLVVAAPVVTPADGTVFTEGSCTVTLACATEGAVIYYSPKGATPRLTEAYRYTAPFTITDTATIKAIAVLEGVRSEYVTATLTKRSLSLAEAAGSAELTFTTGGDADWIPIGDVTATSGISAQSGAIGDEAETWMQTSVSGAGTFSFQWKVDCEWDDSGDATWDHVAVFTNGVEAARIDGASGWTPMSFTFADAGMHTIRWTFSKDDYDEETLSDHAWVSSVTWTPAGGNADVVVDAGGGKSVTVPGTWIAEHAALVEAAGGDASAALATTAANGRKVWECYALGLDPEDNSATNDFKITSFPLKSDGTPDVEHIVFDPPQARWNVPATYKVKGAVNLNDTVWPEVTDENKGALRFFKVEVVLP